MHKFTDEEVDFILNDIIANGVTIEDLQYNLLDHICCIIENEKPETEDFYKFYEDILPRFFKQELKEIQEETDNLLKFKHYYAMKKTLKITGLISSILMLFGALFKTLHWPGAGVMIVLGAASFSLIFLPLMIVLKFRDEEKTTDKLVFAFSFILAITAILGSLFKVMHWPSANILMIGSAILFILVYIPIYFISRYRRVEHRFNSIINSILMLGFGCMIFALINSGGSKNILDSVNASYTYMKNNADKVFDSNESLLEQNNGQKYTDFHNSSTQLTKHLEDTKAFLISKVNEIPMENAYGLSLLEINNPNDYQIIRHYFEEGNGEFSLPSLVKKVESYNAFIKEHYPEDNSKIIALNELQLDRTILSVLLYELAQMQWQIATNENSYLSNISN